MPRSPLFLLAALLAAPALTAAADESRVDADGCEVVRIHPDGSRSVTPPKHGGRTGSASVVQRGGGSSVSVSSRSSGSGASAAASSVSTGDGRSRSITTTQDDKGCRVVIDERPARGEP